MTHAPLPADTPATANESTHNNDAGAPPKVWRRPDGSPVACVEKIRLLNENFVELRQLAQDAFDDALLMGCSERQVRDAFRALFENLTPSFPERHD
ncbi:hypothetical protein HCX48_07215 [Rhodocyclus tenuis]|uniref:Uncharacterized protein n=2 Tax=Rhodocyclus TaxID=1064 RepID=A0A6L5JXH8_RHOTE|nr:hypothetical protein [Rhodocyclus gracilis]MQY51731.1 hypothetical protein [Rhodocyclus gracilis]MRD73211.1 hypothetical protein [Rhodocyclus gracilis]NJA89008.1 hypothetical protein [Rhodocyclus gracilis]